MTCKCETETLPANASPDTPYFPGIRRHPTTRIVTVSPDCLQHSYRLTTNVAAILRYGD